MPKTQNRSFPIYDKTFLRNEELILQSVLRPRSTFDSNLNTELTYFELFLYLDATF